MNLNKIAGVQNQIRAYTNKAASKVNLSGRVIDMRSDTVTRPSQRMKDVMMTCAVGDDIFGDDPTVNYMQQ